MKETLETKITQDWYWTLYKYTYVADTDTNLRVAINYGDSFSWRMRVDRLHRGQTRAIGRMIFALK